MQSRISHASILTMANFQSKKILFTLRNNTLFSRALRGSDLGIIINISSLTRVADSHILNVF